MAITGDQLKTLPENPDKSVASSGKDHLLQVDGGTASTPSWITVGGQRNAPLDQTADSIDASHKSSGGWKQTLPGLKGWSCSYSGLIILNDDGLTILDYCFRNSKQAHVRFIDKEGNYQEGWCYVTKLTKDTSYTAVATYTATLSGVGAISETKKDATYTPGTATSTASAGTGA